MTKITSFECTGCTEKEFPCILTIHSNETNKVFDPVNCPYANNSELFNDKKVKWTKQINNLVQEKE